jgi:hypothetical protein
MKMVGFCPQRIAIGIGIHGAGYNISQNGTHYLQLILETVLKVATKDQSH